MRKKTSRPPRKLNLDRIPDTATIMGQDYQTQYEGVFGYRSAAHQDLQHRPMTAASAHYPAPPAGGVILLAEDNEVLRNGIQMLLEADGFTVLTAANGAEALQQMQMVVPDLILSDIAMPGMDGYELCEKVRSHSEWIAIPFIFLTARAGREEIIRGKKLGVEDYLIKPVSHQELITTIRSRLARNQQLLLAQLQQSYEMSLIMLSNAIEVRDFYTRGHVERVMDIAMMIGREMGLGPSDLKALQFGSILHDVGKILIREDVLTKAGRLTATEWDEMKNHPVLGAELIRNIPYLEAAIPIIRHHHERWDGSGYPDGLKGDEIPMGARIVTVADSLDAMTTSRVYQEASLPEMALSELVIGSGDHYDPKVVQALLSIWDLVLTRISRPNR